MANKQYRVVIPISALAEKGLAADDCFEMDSVKGDEWVSMGILKEFNLAEVEAQVKRDKELEERIDKDIKSADAAAEGIISRIMEKIEARIGTKNFNKMLGANAAKDSEERKSLKFGDILRGIAAKHHGQRFGGWEDAVKQYEGAVKAVLGQAEGTDNIGGYLVDEDFDASIDNRLGESNILLPMCDIRQVSAGSNSLKWNGLIDYDRTDGNHPLSVAVVAEGDPISPSTANFEQFTLTLLKFGGLNYQTNELLKDTRNLMSDIEDWFVQEFGWEMDNNIFEGPGGATGMVGFLGHASNVAVARDTASQVKVEDAQQMWSRLWSGSKQKPGTSWRINADLSPSLNSFQIGDQPVYIPQGNVAGAPFGLLFGKRVMEFEHCKSIGTLGDINLVDMSQYRVIEKAGIEAMTSEHVAFTTDQMALRVIKRANGRPKWSTVQTPQNGSNTVSPFISLAT